MKCYKYISPDISLLILKENSLRFTQPRALNDVFELTPTFTEQVNENVIKQLFEELVANGQFSKEFDRIIREGYHNLDENSKMMFSLDDFEFLTQSMLDRKLEKEKTTVDGFLYKYFIQNNSLFKETLLKNWINILNENIGVLSLSAVPNNILMWGHYCKANQGIVLEFSTENDFFKPLLKIEYSENPPELNLANWEEFIKTPSLGMPILTTKSSIWAYEQEYRVYKYLSHSNSIIRNNSLDFPIYLYNFPLKSLTEVIFGLNTPQKVVNEILEVCALKRYPNINFRKITTSLQSKYEYEIIQI